MQLWLDPLAPRTTFLLGVIMAGGAEAAQTLAREMAREMDENTSPELEDAHTVDVRN